ncbi:MAG: PAS domain-containing protein [Chitinophagaceae bacterium]|nr:PAS domain-containing protein [Chitinophagaceae bacterium]
MNINKEKFIIESEKNKEHLFSNQEIEFFLANLAIGIARLDAKYNFSYVNQTFSKIVKYNTEELFQNNFSLLLSPGITVANQLSAFLPATKENTENNILQIITSSGENIHCNVQVNDFMDDDGNIFFMVLIEDSTQKIAEEKMLKESLLRYNLLNKATKEGLWDWNINSRDLYYNNNIKLLFGYNEDEMKEGFEWWKSNIHKEDSEKVLEKLSRAMEETNIESIHNEYRFLCKDGSYKVIADWFSILRDISGKPYRLIVSMQDHTEQRDLEKQLTEKEIVYRRQLARTVMDTQESERRKLAEELHDNVNQLLGVVKLYIEHSITNDNIREGLLKKSNEYIDKAIVELRNLSKNLAPPLLKELGIEHSVNSLADIISGVQDINITVDMMDFDQAGLTESHMLMLYRIIQEQLNNITKHSKAKNASIIIRKPDAKVQLTIIDDGIGVNLSENNQGMGLRNVRNRIELYQGSIEMISSPGNGFTLKVEFEI